MFQVYSPLKDQPERVGSGFQTVNHFLLISVTLRIRILTPKYIFSMHLKINLWKKELRIYVSEIKTAGF